MPKIIIKKKLVSRKRKITQKRTKQRGGGTNGSSAMKAGKKNKFSLPNSVKNFGSKVKGFFTPKKTVKLEQVGPITKPSNLPAPFAQTLTPKHVLVNPELPGVYITEGAPEKSNTNSKVAKPNPLQNSWKQKANEYGNIKNKTETIINPDWIKEAKKHYETEYNPDISVHFTPKERVEYLNKFLINKARREITESNPEINPDALKKILQDRIQNISKEIHNKKTLKLAQKNKSDRTIYDNNWATETLKGFDKFIIEGAAGRQSGESDENYTKFLRRRAADLLTYKSGYSKIVGKKYDQHSSILQNWKPADITKYYDHAQYLEREAKARQNEIDAEEYRLYEEEQKQKKKKQNRAEYLMHQYENE